MNDDRARRGKRLSNLVGVIGVALLVGDLALAVGNGQPSGSVLFSVSASSVAAAPSGIEGTCAADPDFSDARTVARVFPDEANGEPLFTHIYGHETDDVRRFADLLDVPYEDLQFLVEANPVTRTSEDGAYALRVVGACPDDLLAALTRGFTSSQGTPLEWTPVWASTNVGGQSVFTAPLPKDFGPGWTLYALVRGDVLIFAYSDEPQVIEGLFSELRLAPSGESATVQRWSCQPIGDGGPTLPVDKSRRQADLIGEYQVVETDTQPVTPDILEQTCMITAQRHHAADAGVLRVRVVGGDRVQVLLPGTVDEARIRRLIGTTGVLKVMPVPASYSAPVTVGQVLPPGMEDLELLFTGIEVEDARVLAEEGGTPMLDLSLKERGWRVLKEHAIAHQGERIAVVLDGIVIATIRPNAHDSEHLRIRDQSRDDLEDLGSVLRYGSLPMEIMEVGFYGF